MKVNWAILPNSIVVNFDGKTKNISIENARLHEKVLSALKEGRDSDILTLLEEGSGINGKNPDVEFRDGAVYIDGDKVGDVLSERIVEYRDSNIPFSALVEFWRNLKQNPSYRARERLFLFLENGGHPFTNDGHFIAYKAVTNDFKDIRTRLIDNSIGSKPSMDRSQISDDPTVTCAPGLHVASFAYLPACYGASHTYVCVKVNPKNVVSIPVDYQNQKMRVCEYEVVSISDGPLKEVHYSTESSDSSESDESSESAETSSSSTDSSSDSSDSESETQPKSDLPPMRQPKPLAPARVATQPPSFVMSSLAVPASANPESESESESSSSEDV